MRTFLVSLIAASCLCSTWTSRAAAQCPPGAAESCFVPHANPGCDEPACCNNVCAVDPICCTSGWDAICVGEANAICGGLPSVACCIDDVCFDIPVFDCQGLNGLPGADGSTCAVDGCPDPVEACCNPTTNQCAGDVPPADCINLLEGVPLGPGSSCAFANCLAVACCFGGGECSNLIAEDCSAQGGSPQPVGTTCETIGECPTLCGGLGGSCFVANGTPGCDDQVCCALICTADPFCCDTEWDQICADAALAQCVQSPAACCFADGSCQDLTPGLCDSSGGTPQPSGTNCLGTVCPIICGDPGAGSCFVDNGTPGCDDATCCSLVCAGDAFCCDTEWDQLCADAAIAMCVQVDGACCFPDGTCQVLTPGACADAGGTPQASGSTCEGTVCPMICGDPGSGSCFADNGTPGCDDATCCSLVCAGDAFCCDTEWDQVCADAAIAMCAQVDGACCFLDGTCQELTPGACDAAGGTPQASGSTCVETICPVICGDPLAGGCFVPNGTIGCDDAECCNIVCADDPFCCETEWDQVCADGALEMCSGAPTEACCFFDGSCLDLTTVACGDQGGTSQGLGSDCLTAICPVELPEACCLGFLGNCQDLQPTPCNDAGGTPQGLGTTCETTTCPVICPGTGDCFVANGTPGCDDPQCCDTVCSDDAFCCDTEWDQICADSAAVLCAGAACQTCPGDVNNDAVVNGLDVQAMTDCLLDPANGPGVPATAVCACGDTDSDGDVDLDDVAGFVNAALNLTGACPNPACGVPGSGLCISTPDGNPVATGTPGCEDGACCDLVCAADPFCCATNYDQFCQAEGRAICNGDPTTGCTTAIGCIDITVADCAALAGVDTMAPCP